MLKKAVIELFKYAKILACDFDGTLTDGYVYFNQDGVETVRCSRKDGYAANLLREKGIHMVIISQEPNPIVATRAKKMKIDYFHAIESAESKLEILKRYILDNNVSPAEVVYIGDDVNDIGCMNFAGVGVTVSDGHDECKKIADYITVQKGGEHAVREVCDLILQAHV